LTAFDGCCGLLDDGEEKRHSIEKKGVSTESDHKSGGVYSNRTRGADLLHTQGGGIEGRRASRKSPQKVKTLNTDKEESPARRRRALVQGGGAVKRANGTEKWTPNGQAKRASWNRLSKTTSECVRKKGG